MTADRAPALVAGALYWVAGGFLWLFAYDSAGGAGLLWSLAYDPAGAADLLWPLKA